MNADHQLMRFTTLGADRKLRLPIALGHFLPWYTLRGADYPLPEDQLSTISHPATIEDGRHWSDPRAAYRRTHRHMPEIGRYDSRDPATLRWQFECMNEAGLSGMMINWNGQNSVENTITLAVLDEFERWDDERPQSALSYCFSIDSQAQLPTEGKIPVSLIDDVAYIKENLLRPGYLCRDDRPVFSCFPYEDNLPVWIDAFDRVFGEGRYDFLWMNSPQNKGETGCFLWVEPNEASTDYDSIYPWRDPEDIGDHRAQRRYADWSEPRYGYGYSMAGVWPGFDDSLVAWAWKPPRLHDRVRPRIMARHNSQGSCYKQLWETYLAALADPGVIPLPIVQIVTWNDWAEATEIEPSVDHGREALRVTRNYIELARTRWESLCRS